MKSVTFSFDVRLIYLDPHLPVICSSSFGRCPWILMSPMQPTNPTPNGKSPRLPPTYRVQFLVGAFGPLSNVRQVKTSGVVRILVGGKRG